MTRILLVRHAEPVVDTRTPPAWWPLTAKGREEASALGRRLAEGTTTTIVWTSPERKAYGTAELVFPSVPIRVQDQLREVKRVWYAKPDKLAKATESYLGGNDVDGWERRESAISRLAQLKANLPLAERLAVVSHGVLLTTWLDHEVGLEDSFRFWSNLQMPDAWEVDPQEKSVKRIT